MMGPPRVNLYQLVLALAALAAVSYLGVHGTLSGDAVAGMIAGIVAFVTGGNIAQTQTSATAKASNGKSDVNAATLDAIHARLDELGAAPASSSSSSTSSRKKEAGS